MDVMLSAFLSFIATNIDYLLILILLFAEYRKKSKVLSISIGYLIGLTLLIAASYFIGYSTTFIDNRWIGLLGFIPIYLGLKTWFKQSDHCDDESDEIIKKVSKHSRFIVGIIILTIATGADNLGVYIPYFATLTTTDSLIAIVIFYILAILLIILTYFLSKLKVITSIFEKIEHILVPLVFIGLGFMILIENGTLVLPF